MPTVSLSSAMKRLTVKDHVQGGIRSLKEQHLTENPIFKPGPTQDPYMTLGAGISFEVLKEIAENPMFKQVVPMYFYADQEFVVACFKVIASFNKDDIKDQDYKDLIDMLNAKKLFSSEKYSKTKPLTHPQVGVILKKLFNLGKNPLMTSEVKNEDKTVKYIMPKIGQHTFYYVCGNGLMTKDGTFLDYNTGKPKEVPAPGTPQRNE